MKKDENLAPSGQTTQFIVGASNETDSDILKRVDWLIKKLTLNVVILVLLIPWKVPLSKIMMNPILKELEGFTS